MIGMMKTKIAVYCEVCGQKHVRNIQVGLVANTDEAKETAKQECIRRAQKPYTCRICKSILAA